MYLLSVEVIAADSDPTEHINISKKPPPIPLNNVNNYEKLI